MASRQADTIGERVKYPRYIKSKTELDQAFKRIAVAVREGKAEWLFGTGMSATSRIPQGNALAEKLLSEEFFPGAAANRPSEKKLKRIASVFPLEAVSAAVERSPGKGRADLTKSLKRILLGKMVPELSAHDLFLSICYWDDVVRVQRVFTTNYDDLLERAFDGKAIPVNFDNYEETKNAEHGPSSPIPVVHLHGTLEGEYKITEREVYQTASSRLGTLLQVALDKADAFVFVGYSMSDPDLRSIYMDYRERILGRDPGPTVEEKTTYVVGPAKSGSHYEVGREIWRSRGAIWIPFDALRFFKQLRAFLEYESGEEVRDKLLTSFDMTDAKVFSQKVDRIADVLAVSRADAFGFLNESRTLAGGRR